MKYKIDIYRFSSMTIAMIAVLLMQVLSFLNVTAQNSITEAKEHFLRFNSVNGGWCASDATISLLMPDGKTLWLFGDTFLGEKNGEYSIRFSGSKMINNSAILDDGNSLTAYYGGTMQNPASLIPGDGPDIFWPEHATIENDTLKVFAIRVIFQDNGLPGFNFRVGTSYIASYKYPEMEYINTSEIKSLTDTTMRFGACIVKSGDYKYIFGKKDTTLEGFTYPLPYLARVAESVEEPWQFYAGPDTWSYDCRNAVPVGDRPMSESFYVYEKDNKFYLLMHEIWLVGELFILEADNIAGPWNRSASGGIENRFAVIRPHTNNITYNLFAHPQFRKDGKILISFNVNTSDFSSIYKDTRNYRARFYWLSVEDAVNAVIPDTIELFDKPVGIGKVDYGNYDEKLSYNQATNSIYVRRIVSTSLISIFGADGRVYLNREITADTEINCSHLPKTLLIVRLQGKWGIETKKIVLR